MPNQENAAQTATQALEAKGLHVVPLTDEILNVHSAPTTGDETADQATYLFTLTVSVTE